MRASANDHLPRGGTDHSGSDHFSPRKRTLVVRLDNGGEVLLAGPAVRAIARQSHVTFLTAPGGAEAAALLPGVADVLTWRAPWAGTQSPRLDGADVSLLIRRMAAGSFDDALILTSRHQSPLPTALVLRLAGISPIAAMSQEVPGSLLDVWHNPDPDDEEPGRSLSLARAAGYDLAPGDNGGLAIRRPLPATEWLTGRQPYVVAHSGAAWWRPERWPAAVVHLARRGYRVVLTGAAGERGRIAAALGPAGVAPEEVVDLAGRTDLLQLASVVDRALAVLAGTPGMEHLATAVHTPVARQPWRLRLGREPTAAGLG
jgi:ADP-heptose:LPS heptosyltransferase